MNKKNVYLGMFFASLFGALMAIGGVLYFVDTGADGYPSISDRQEAVLVGLKPDGESENTYIVPEGLNFIEAAEQVTPGVVHIRSQYGSGQYSMNPLDNMFRQGRPAQSSGSGVIISDDGYIVTNNHVIEDASQVEVVLNDKREYSAKVIGTDPTTDLALIKIDAADLQFVRYGNSDKIKTGEWVLAVGNPFNLNSTVTAGIVSAKARNIGILRDENNLQIESFLQTDAAVNPGNSGGALVNLKGQLVGINTAIATPTGTYAGYSFAVPVNLVKKVMDDLLEFGEVQRGLLGIRINDVNARLAEDQGLKDIKGIYVVDVNENSAAEEAGIESEDVIFEIDGEEVASVAELQELVARKRPGDEISVAYRRDGSIKRTKAVLKNFEGNTDLIKKEVSAAIEGAQFEELSSSELKALGIGNGVRVKRLGPGKWAEAGFEKGDVIVSIDRKRVDNVKELHRILADKEGGVLVEGIDENGKRFYEAIGW